jgi:hypothetical protein
MWKVCDMNNKLCYKCGDTAVNVDLNLHPVCHYHFAKQFKSYHKKQNKENEPRNISLYELKKKLERPLFEDKK